MSDTEKIDISFVCAKELAQTRCDTLSEDFLEAEHCWIFFNEDKSDFAVAVSKSGEVSHVYDLRDNPKMMDDYLEMFSAYCSGDKLLTENLHREFMRRYYATGPNSSFNPDALTRAG